MKNYDLVDLDTNGLFLLYMYLTIYCNSYYEISSLRLSVFNVLQERLLNERK